MKWPPRRRRLSVAAGIARMDLVCASSVWSSLLNRCVRQPGAVHFFEGMQQPAGAGLVRVRLSGLELSELLDVTARRGRWEDLPGRALCRAVYRAAAVVIDELDPGHGHGAIPPIKHTAGALHPDATPAPI